MIRIAIAAIIIALLHGVAGATPPYGNPIYPSNIGDVFSDAFQSGTWTPNLRGSTTSGSVTYALNGQLGDYDVSGAIVNVKFHIVTTAVSGATGALEIDSLPFVPASSATTVRGGCAVTGYSGIDLRAGYLDLSAWVSIVDGAIVITKSGSSPLALAFIDPAVDVSAAVTLDGACTYRRS